MSMFQSGLVIVVVELVWSALTKGYQIWLRLWLVVVGAEVGDLDPACTIVKVVLPPSADLLSMNQRRSSFG